MTDEQLKTIANYIADWTYQYLISTTGISRPEAKRAAINAADKAGQSLAQDLTCPDWAKDVYSAKQSWRKP